MESQLANISTQVFRFDPFTLDVRSHELRNQDRACILQSQPFEILMLLLERAGGVVLRDEIRRSLWAEGTFVDYEHSLNAAIKRLRNALGDDPREPKFIETIPRRGYRFVASVAEPAKSAVNAVGVGARARRLAVLPAIHAGVDRGFAEGLCDELRTLVAKMSGGAVAVIARSSSLAADGHCRRASEIGEQLRADYLLEGSVRGDGDRIRITACVVETAGETHVWSDAIECRHSASLTTQVEAAMQLTQSFIRALLTLRKCEMGRPEGRHYITCNADL